MLSTYGTPHLSRPERTANPKKMDRAPLVEASASDRLTAARDSGSGTPAAPAGDRLRLLPSGPDLVHKPTPRGTRTIDAPCGGATRAKPLEGEFSPARADCGFRAPLHPRLARSTSDPSAEATHDSCPASSVVAPRMSRSRAWTRQRVRHARGGPMRTIVARTGRYALRCRTVMNFTYFHSPKSPRRARLGVTLAMLGTAALIAGCGSSSGSSTITVGNESDTNSVPHVSGEKTPTSTTPTTTTPTATVKTPTSGPLATQPKVTVRRAPRRRSS